MDPTVAAQEIDVQVAADPAAERQTSGASYSGNGW